MRNKKIQILLVFVLAIGLFGLLFYWRYGEKKQMESLNGLQETYKEYDKKIREIRNDMENKKAEARFYIRILKKWILRSGWLLRKMHLL